jgi:alcohol dehydrogenase class IV
LGSINTLPDEIAFYKLSKPCLVVDEGIAKAGLLEQWLPSSVASITPRITCPVNPNLDAVRAGVNQAKEAKVDGVVIVGGGSSICLGKAIAICMVNPGDILDYEGNEKLQKVGIYCTLRHHSG